MPQLSDLITSLIEISEDREFRHQLRVMNLRYYKSPDQRHLVLRELAQIIDKHVPLDPKNLYSLTVHAMVRGREPEPILINAINRL